MVVQKIGILLDTSGNPPAMMSAVNKVNAILS